MKYKKGEFVDLVDFTNNKKIARVRIIDLKLKCTKILRMLTLVMHVNVVLDRKEIY